MIQQTQERIADTTGAAGIVLTSLSLLEILHVAGAVLGIACAAFSLYFHVKRFIKERKQ